MNDAMNLTMNDLRLTKPGTQNAALRDYDSVRRAIAFISEHWREGPGGLPVLRGALSSHVCSVEAAYDYGTHTIFIGRVDEVFLPEISVGNLSPLIWLNGSCASLAATCKA